MKKIYGIYFYPLIIMGCAAILLNACKKYDIPVLTTSDVSFIMGTQANCGGLISSDGGATVTERGICWSTGSTPTIDNDKSPDDSIGSGSFKTMMTGLSLNTTYYVRAYATNSEGTEYGEAKSFTTLPATSGPVTDIDGNIYQTVIIGSQIWMAENLKVTRYRNGDSIPCVTGDIEWNDLATGAFCFYENIADHDNVYGKLYNWYAVNDSRGIAPAGWHIPTDAEWTVMTDYLGGDAAAGGKLKETDTVHWNSPNTGATNVTGFTALPGGYRLYNGAFFNIGAYGIWWSSSSFNDQYAWKRGIINNNSSTYRNYYNKEYGFSVRCVKN